MSDTEYVSWPGFQHFINWPCFQFPYGETIHYMLCTIILYCMSHFHGMVNRHRYFQAYQIMGCGNGGSMFLYLTMRHTFISIPSTWSTNSHIPCSEPRILSTPMNSGEQQWSPVSDRQKQLGVGKLLVHSGVTVYIWSDIYLKKYLC